MKRPSPAGQLPDNGDEPATKADVRAAADELAEATVRSFERIESQMATKDDLARLEQRMATKDALKAFKDEIIRHFDVVAEKIHRDVASANRDEILALKDTDEKLDERVATIEQHLGLPWS